MGRRRVPRALAGLSGPAATPLAGTERSRLRTYIRFNLAASLLAAVSLGALLLLPVPAGWVGGLVLLCLGLTACLVWAMKLVHYDRYVTAVIVFAFSNWIVCVSAAALVPFALVDLFPIVLVPALLAIQHMNRAQLSAVLGATLVVAAAVAAAGIFQPGLGLERRVPAAVADAFAITFTPLMAALFSFSVWQTHATMTDKTETLRKSRVRLVSAADRERRQIERDLHERAIGRLTSAALQARIARRLLAVGSGRVTGVLADLTDDLQAASEELRDLAHGIFPPELTEHGLRAALPTMAMRAPLPTFVRLEGVGRYPPEVEISVYFCCVKAVENAVQHAGDGATVSISVRHRNGLVFDIRDDGKGCTLPEICAGHTVASLSDRLGAIGGNLAVHAGPGRGVHLNGYVPRTVLLDPRRRRIEVLNSVVLWFFGTLWDLSSRPWGALRRDGPRHHVITGVTALLAVTLCSAPLLLAAYPGVRSTRAVILLAAAALATAALLPALRAATRGSIDRAVAVAATAFWWYALVVAAASPRALPYASLLVVIPVVLAAQLPRRHFLAVIGVTVAFSAVAALAGRLLPGARAVPDPRSAAAGLAFTALVVLGTNVASFLAWQTHVTLVEKAEALQDSRARLIAAADRERRQIERDLHDGAQQRLVAAALRSRLAQRLLHTNPDMVPAALDGLAEDLREATRELHELALGVYPPHLAEHGLGAALRAAAERAPLPVTVAAKDARRYRPDVEINVYFCCLEALQNATKHAGDKAAVTITLHDGDGLTFDVRDDGKGCRFAALQDGHGFANMRDRLSAVGGILTIDAAPGRGVHVHGHIGASAIGRLGG